KTSYNSFILLGSTQNMTEGECTNPCAYPINFRQVGNGSDAGGGILHFDYTWDSSDGKPSHLVACEVGEYVTYPGTGDYVPPHPPWSPNWSYPNPTTRSTSGNQNHQPDNHQNPGYSTPYSNNSFTS